VRRPTPREWLLIAVVPALLLAGALAGQDGGEGALAVVEARPAAKTPGDARKVAAAAALDLEQLRRDARAVNPDNAFASRTWYVPPPPAPPPVKLTPAPPSAPALPFVYLGRYAEAGETTFFLVKGDRVLTVRKGDLIEGHYRVDGLDGTKLNLTYVPLGTKQQLDTGTPR